MRAPRTTGISLERIWRHSMVFAHEVAHRAMRVSQAASSPVGFSAGSGVNLMGVMVFEDDAAAGFPLSRALEGFDEFFIEELEGGFLRERFCGMNRRDKCFERGFVLIFGDGC